MAGQNDDMTKEDRRIAILRFLSDVDLAMKPRAVYYNMHDRGATFSERTVKRLLHEMLDEGLVEKRFNGDYYQISQTGREYLQG